MMACVRSSALAVFREIGTGATESVYQHALATELRLSHATELRMEHVFGLEYRGLQCGTARADLFIPSIPAVVELKAKGNLSKADREQTRLYVQHLGCAWGLLLNFSTSGVLQAQELVGHGCDVREETKVSLGESTD